MQKGVMFFHSMFSSWENRVRKLKCTRPLTRYGCRWCLNESYLKVDFLEIDSSSEQNFALHPQLIFILKIIFLFLFSRKFAKCICTRHFQIWFSREQRIQNLKQRTGKQIQVFCMRPMNVVILVNESVHIRIWFDEIEIELRDVRTIMRLYNRYTERRVRIEKCLE